MVKCYPMTGLTHVSSGKYFLYWASLMAGATVLASSDWASTMKPLTMQRLSNDRLDRALNWTLWSTGAVMGSVAYLSIAKTSLMHHYIDFIHVEHLCATIISSAFYIYVIKNGLPHLTKNVPPLQNRLLYGAIGTAVTGAITSAALNIFTKSYTPWGKQGVAIQAIFSLACGLLYSQLGINGLQRSAQDFVNGWNNWLNKRPRGPAPFWLREEIEKTPELLAKMMCESKYTLITTHMRLKFIFDALGLQGEAGIKFGEAFARSTDVEYRSLADRKLHPMIHFDQIITACLIYPFRGAVLEGNLIIQTLSKVLAYESHHTIEVGIGQQNSPMEKLPIDVIRRLCLHLDPTTILNLARVSRRFYHCLGLQGAPVWAQRKIDCFRELHSKTTNSMAFLLAWPDHLLHNFEEFDDLKEGVAILRSACTPLEKLSSLVNQQTEAKYVLMVRLVRNKPELFKEKAFWKTCTSAANAKPFWTVLEQFGLPWEALESFCTGIKENKAGNDEVLLCSWGVMQRVRQDFPYFFPETNLFAPLYPDF